MTALSVFWIFLLTSGHSRGGTQQNKEKRLQRRLSSPGTSRLSALLMGLPSVVINVEHLNVDRPEELNINIGKQDDTGTESSILNAPYENITDAERQNDKFLKNFYNASIIKTNENEGTKQKFERKNITYLIQKLLNKRDNSYASKIVHFKGQTKSKAPNKNVEFSTPKKPFVKVNNRSTKDSNIDEIVEQINKIQENVLCSNQSRTKGISSETDHISVSINKLKEMQFLKINENEKKPFDKATTKRVKEESISQYLNSDIDDNDEVSHDNNTQDTYLHNDSNDQDTPVDNDKNIKNDLHKRKLSITDFPQDSTTYIHTYMYNLESHGSYRDLNNETTKQMNDNNMIEKGNIENTDAKQDKDGNPHIDLNPCLTANLTKKESQITSYLDTRFAQNCTTAKDFLRNNCGQDNEDDVADQGEDNSQLEDILEFYHFQHSNHSLNIENQIVEKCCNGNHILEVLKMLNKIIPRKIRNSFFQAKELKTKKESWIFTVGKKEVILTKSDISRIVKHGYATYHNHIDGFRLFECKIFGRCEVDEGKNAKQEERKKQRKDKKEEERNERKNKKIYKKKYQKS